MASNGYQWLTLANIANTCWIGNKSETINQGYLLGEAIGSEKLRDALDGCTWLEAYLHFRLRLLWVARRGDEGWTRTGRAVASHRGHEYRRPRVTCTAAHNAIRITKIKFYNTNNNINTNIVLPADKHYYKWPLTWVTFHCCNKGLFCPLKSAQIEHLTRAIFLLLEIWFDQVGLFKWPCLGSVSGKMTVIPLSLFYEKWSQNFDSGTQSDIFGTPKMAKTGSF